MVRRLVIEGQDGLRRWGYFIDDGQQDDGYMMAAGTMRASLPGVAVTQNGVAVPTFETSMLPARPTFGHVKPPAALIDMKTINAAKEGLTHHRWGDASPFTPRRAPVEVVREPTPPAASAVHFALEKPLATHARFQIEMLKNRSRYVSKLAEGGGLMLTRTTGY